MAELMLLISMHLYLAQEINSAELPIFLSISASTFMTHVKNGRLRLCMALGAGLVGGAKRGSVPPVNVWSDGFPCQTVRSMC